MKTTKDEFTINWLTPEKDIVKEPSELEEKAAELVKEALTESGFKTGEIKDYDRCYDQRGYRFEIDLTSMFKAK